MTQIDARSSTRFAKGASLIGQQLREKLEIAMVSNPGTSPRANLCHAVRVALQRHRSYNPLLRSTS